MMMEELLWKYIDNDCTPEEIEKVKVLLETDHKFKELYNEYTQLDMLIYKNLNVDLSIKFRNELEKSIIKTITGKQASIYNLRNIQWVAIILFVITGIITYYFSTGDPVQQHQLLAQIFSSLGKESLYLFNIVVISLVLLITLDWLLKYVSKYRSALL